jgi:DNA-binding response OmpR family regulator
MAAAPRPALLFVDDDAALTQALARIARAYGDVAIAASVAQARALLASPRSWTAFVIDEGLPDGSGLDLLTGARRSFPSTPALMLTGQTEAATINRAFDLRADYVVKPVDAARLRRFLGDAVAGAHAALARAAPLSGLQALEKRIRELRLLLSRPPEPMTRPAIGALVADLKARPEVYGAAAVATAAQAVAEDIPTLYRYACVAERWSASELRAVVRREGRDRRTLSWSHVVTLAAVPSGAVRERLIGKALSKALSVRELEALVRQEESRG